MACPMDFDLDDQLLDSLVYEQFLEEDAWQDCLPSISFYEDELDDLDLEKNLSDLISDDSWMELLPCCHGYQGK